MCRNIMKADEFTGNGMWTISAFIRENWVTILRTTSGAWLKSTHAETHNPKVYPRIFVCTTASQVFQTFKYPQQLHSWLEPISLLFPTSTTQYVGRFLCLDLEAVLTLALLKPQCTKSTCQTYITHVEMPHPHIGHPRMKMSNSLKLTGSTPLILKHKNHTATDCYSHNCREFGARVLQQKKQNGCLM